MKAAIYCRKSTGQHIADDAKSVVRQEANARAFAAKQGWTVDAVFVDDGVSGADARRLVQRQRMIEAASKGRYDVIVMQAQDRFSRRDGHVAFAELEQLAQHAEIWFYADASRFTSGTFESNVTGILKGEFAAEFRRAIAAKTHEAMRRRAELGYVTGNRVFGYDIVPASNGFKDRVINAAEAKVIREIYQRFADGEGLKAICHELNRRKLPAPRAQGRKAAWDPGTVRAILRRPLYRGVVVWDRTKKRDKHGSRHVGRAPKKPESQWSIKERADLRIVEPKVSDLVDARLEQRRNAYLRDTRGKLLGRPRGVPDHRNKRLLTGFIVCACGGTFESVRGRYACSTRRRKGPAVCPSEFTFDAASIENVFLDALEDVVLSPRFIDRLLDGAFVAPPDHDALKAERTRLVLEITNLTAAIASGGDIPALAAALKERDRRLHSIDRSLSEPPPDRAVLKAALELRSAQWRDVLRGPHIDQARVVLQHLIELPIKVVNQPIPPYIKRGDTRGTENIGKKWMTQIRETGLLAGLIQNVASPTGFEPVFWP